MSQIREDRKAGAWLTVLSRRLPLASLTYVVEDT
jgi:hypothetical protein